MIQLPTDFEERSEEHQLNWLRDYDKLNIGDKVLDPQGREAVVADFFHAGLENEFDLRVRLEWQHYDWHWDMYIDRFIESVNKGGWELKGKEVYSRHVEFLGA